jgi:hypothetical protein
LKKWLKKQELLEIHEDLGELTDEDRIIPRELENAY